MSSDPLFSEAANLSYMGKSAVPPYLQFRSDQTVLCIGGVILPERPVGCIAGSIKVATEGVPNLFAAVGHLHLGLGGGGDRAGLNDGQQ